MSESSLRRASFSQMISNLSIESDPLSRSPVPKTAEGHIQEEITDGTVQFPSSELTRMFSQESFDDALSGVVAQLETFSYDPPGSCKSTYHASLASFLTSCLTACHDALDKREGSPKRDERWYADLEFVVGIPAAGGIDRKPLADKPAHSIMLPVEVKGDWKGAVSQAATYARGFSAACPMRMIVLVLAYKHDNLLKFLVFHRGGLAVSEPSDITKVDGLKEVARLFLALASRRTAVEAGTVACCDDTTYLFPTDGGGRCMRSATTEDRSPGVFQSPRKKPPKPSVGGVGLVTGRPYQKFAGIESGPTTRGVSLPEQTDGDRVQTGFNLGHFQSQESARSAHDSILKSAGLVVLKTSWPGVEPRHGCTVRLGTMPQVCPDKVPGGYGEVTSKIPFFPGEEIAERRWPILTAEAPPSTMTNKHTFLSVGVKPLTEAENPWQLSRAWADSLLGWLSIYLFGHLHRNLSLGTVLMGSGERKWFEIPDEFQEHLSSLQQQLIKEAVKNQEVVAETDEKIGQPQTTKPSPKKENKSQVVKIEEAVKAIKEQCVKVEEFVVKLNISNEPHGVITDGDLAVQWSKYWDTNCQVAKSGTPEFMSLALLGTRGEYLHSPVDDLESFFWVALWSVVFHVKANPKLESEWNLREALLRNSKGEAMQIFSNQLFGKKGCDDVMLRFQGVIDDWWKTVRDLNREWRLEVMESPPENAGSGYYLPHFHRFALRGVLDVLEVLEKHWNGEISWKSWTGP